MTDTIGLHFSTVVIGDTLAVDYPDSSVNGAIYTTKGGDVSQDGKLNVLDIIRLVGFIIGRQAAPTQGSFGFFTADGNGDGIINQADFDVWAANADASALAVVQGIQFKPTKILSNGTLSFTFTNLPGLFLSVLSQTNLTAGAAHWTPRGRIPEISPGTYQFIDLLAINFGQQFYRVTQP